MRRPDVYERSVPRAGHIGHQEPTGDDSEAAHATVSVVPDLLRQAEACGAVVLARYLGQALTEAEGIIVRRAP